MTTKTQAGSKQMKVTRNIEDTALAEWLQSVPETVLAAYKEADERALRARARRSRDRMAESFRESGGKRSDLAGLLGMSDTEVAATFDD